MTDIKPLDESYQHVLDEARGTISRILDLFTQHEIHATWATVGVLFYGSRTELLAGTPSKRPSYRDATLSNYDRLANVGVDETQDPYHFGQSLIRRIAAAPHQEIGTHTFSHYYCLEPRQDIAAFEADIRAAVRAAETLGMHLQSIAFPRHQVDRHHLQICKQLGITVYRGNVRRWPYVPLAKDAQTLVRRVIRAADSYANVTGHHVFPPTEIMEGGIANVRTSHYLRPYSPRLRIFESMKVRRITAAMTQAARSGQVCHLWVHPEQFGHNTEENMRFLESVFAHYTELRSRYGMRSYTMAEQARLAQESERP